MKNDTSEDAPSWGPGNYLSLLPDGTDLRQLTAYPIALAPYGNVQISDFLVGVSGVVGESIIYSTMPNPSCTEGVPQTLRSASARRTYGEVG